MTCQDGVDYEPNSDVIYKSFSLLLLAVYSNGKKSIYIRKIDLSAYSGV